MTSIRTYARIFLIFGPRTTADLARFLRLDGAVAETKNTALQIKPPERRRGSITVIVKQAIYIYWVVEVPVE